jgi:hypothetical protein
MPKLIKISLEGANAMKRKTPREAKKLNEYKGYINALKLEEAGKFKTATKNEYFTLRSGLLRAAQSMDLKLKVKKVGNEIVFWKVPPTSK